MQYGLPGRIATGNLKAFLLQHALQRPGNIQCVIDGVPILVFPDPQDHLSQETGQKELGSDDHGGQGDKEFRSLCQQASGGVQEEFVNA